MKAALQYLHEILTLLGDDRRKLPALVVLFLGASMLDLAGLGLIAPYIALVTQPDSMTQGRLSELLALLNWGGDRQALLIWLSGLLVFLFLGKAFVVLGINNLIIRFAQNQQIRLRSRLMHAYQHLPYSLYLQRNSAEYIHSVQQLTGQFQGVLQQLLRTISDALVALVILGLLVWENAVALSLLVLLVGGTLLAYDRLFRKRMRGYGIRLNRAAQGMVKGVHEGLEGLKEIRILGQEPYFHQQVQRGAEEIAFNERRYQLIQSIPRALLEAVLVVFVVLLVLITLQSEASTGTLLGTLGLFGVAAIRLVPVATLLASNLTTLRFSRDGISRLYADVKQLKESSVKSNRVAHTGESFASLKLENVQYSYPQTKQAALQNLGLEIKAGESIGLVGPSGSGKTTLVDVLLGLLEPQSGTMEFNGRSLLENLEEWRSQVATCPSRSF
ncbi:MAG: ATP-binding cassette domain-containing protein [bacterium]